MWRVGVGEGRRQWRNLCAQDPNVCTHLILSFGPEGSSWGLVFSCSTKFPQNEVPGGLNMTINLTQMVVPEQLLVLKMILKLM